MANLRKQVDVAHCIARFFEGVLCWLLPAPGRHRATHDGSFPCPTPLGLACPPSQTPALSGEAIGLVRPYLVAHEERRAAQRQRARRRVLWFAVHGIDLGPRTIHGVEVGAS
ncbi:hypothetical protein QIS96_29575 [Streptomyces sp. B-S-A6]|uniref:Uncharacterized protein n=1 Tax=Streptomyces cavernicola TaxID=3043613 RepID=A0ABT6SIE8_9ACTN|nr:hypothetical protein [Streptomyces sp. B-S-A6]MDI3407953.1 hypothetical protein [Streptomyces sp. B-S-A6]